MKRQRDEANKAIQDKELFLQQKMKVKEKNKESRYKSRFAKQGLKLIKKIMHESNLELCMAALNGFFGDLSRVRDLEGNTLLIIAVKCGRVELLEHLIAMGCDIDSQNLEGNTGLHYAISYGFYQCRHILLINAANELIENNYRQNPWQMQQDMM